MPRNPDQRSRLSSIAAKLHSIQGLRREEKGLLVRIGNLIDSSVVAQRGLSNPKVTSGSKVSGAIPVPGELTTRLLTDGVALTWNAVDFSFFEGYEVQWDSTTTFSSPQSRITTLRNLAIRDTSATDLHIRVRTISRNGQVSEWSATTTVPVGQGVYDEDQDHILPENRTTVNPHPELLGASLAVTAQDLALIGVGASVGPGPITFTDVANDGDSNPRNQITYVVEENDLLASLHRMGLPTYFNENVEAQFYGSAFFYLPVSFYLLPSGPREFNTFTGSMVDFLEVHSYTFNPAALDVRFLQYIDTPHKQSGIILNATSAIIKH